MKAKIELIIALGFCSISLAVADNSLRISTDTTGASTTFSDKELLEIKNTGSDAREFLAITRGETFNDLELWQVNQQLAQNLFKDRPAYSISRPFLSGQTIRFAFQDELRTRIGEFNDTTGFTERLVNDTASFCDVEVDVNPNTGEAALLRSDCTSGFTLDLQMSGNWVDWTPVDLSSEIGSLVARTIANGAPKPGVSWVNNQVAFTFVAQQDTAMSRLYGGRVNPQSGGVTVYPPNTIVNNAPSTANGTETTQTTMGDYVCYQYVDQMIAKVTVWDPASGDFQVHKLGYVAPGLKESASAAANLGFGRTAFAVDGQFFGTQVSGSFSDDTFEVSNIGSFPIRGFDSGPVDFSLDQDLTGVLVGNVNGSGSFAETNQGNTKVFSQVLQNRSTFDVCNLENEDQHFRTNFIDSAGDLQFNDEFTLGGNECQEYSELNDASAQIGVGYSIFQGSGAFVIKGRYLLGTELGDFSPPTGLNPSNASTQFVVPWSERGVRQGWAFANPRPEEVDCVINIFDEDGMFVADDSFSLSGFGHRARFSSDGIPVPDDFLGSQFIECSDEVYPTFLDVVKGKEQISIFTPPSDDFVRPNRYRFGVRFRF